MTADFVLVGLRVRHLFQAELHLREMRAQREHAIVQAFLLVFQFAQTIRQRGSAKSNNGDEI